MLKKIWEFIFPSRASTQTWMVLTFALFVGSAVVLVGLYVVLVLRGETDQAVRTMLHDQAEQIAVQVEREQTVAERAKVVRDISRLTQLRISVATPDTVIGDADASYLQAGALIDRAALNDPGSEQFVYGQHASIDRGASVHMALYRPSSGLIVRVMQPEPALYSLVQRTQVVLIVGMVMALVLALVGSWVAAYQVVTPLKTIRESARSVSEGQFEGRIRVDSRAAEFQDVAASLNRASASFREKIEDLERLTRLQSEFIGNVSHEVRNPIFAISGYLEALGSPTLGDEQRKRYAEKGLTNLQRLSNLFDDLIEIARLEYREDLIKRKVFNLRELVDEVVDMLRPKASKKGLSLDIDNPDVYVEADRSRIRQVLVNLIDNAIAYTDEGTVRCRIRRRIDKVRVEVVDTGRGIDEEHLQRIFERFYRVDPDRSRESGGTGLGLSIVKQIISAHGEQIHVESTKGRGTRFWFELPYKKEAKLAEAT
jgi:signal transduction histidine kinase